MSGRSFTSAGKVREDIDPKLKSSQGIRKGLRGGGREAVPLELLAPVAGLDGDCIDAGCINPAIRINLP